MPLDRYCQIKLMKMTCFAVCSIWRRSRDSHSESDLLSRFNLLIVNVLTNPQTSTATMTTVSDIGNCSGADANYDCEDTD
jgi:hypothetical protein